MTNFATSFGVKNVQKAKFEAAEMILDPWNQQCLCITEDIPKTGINDVNENNFGDKIEHTL